ncbi:MAG: spore coat protein CotJB [Clostridia bacterium]|nr:spore coat protein CotJB [Clostridia bacterium]
MAVDNENSNALKKIQELEFTALDLNLYLNTHFNDLRAVEQFKRVNMEICKVKKMYEQRYGPLLNFGFGSNIGKTWRWVDSPWPWEM